MQTIWFFVNRPLHNTCYNSKILEHLYYDTYDHVSDVQIVEESIKNTFMSTKVFFLVSYKFLKEIVIFANILCMNDWNMGKSLLIKDTTREERIRIVNKALNVCADSCENCSSCWLGGGSVDSIYADYIEGRKEIAEINMEYSRRFAGKIKWQHHRLLPLRKRNESSSSLIALPARTIATIAETVLYSTTVWQRRYMPTISTVHAVSRRLQWNWDIEQ